MYTYQLKIKNGKDWKKIVYVNANDYHKAVKSMKEIYGKEWIVYESNIIYAE